MEISTFSNSKTLIIRKLTQAITVVGGSLFSHREKVDFAIEVAKKGRSDQLERGAGNVIIPTDELIVFGVGQSPTRWDFQVFLGGGTGDFTTQFVSGIDPGWCMAIVWESRWPAWNGMTEVNTAQVSSCFSTVRHVHTTWRVMRSVWWQELDDAGVLVDYAIALEGLKMFEAFLVFLEAYPQASSRSSKMSDGHFARRGSVLIGPLQLGYRCHRRLPGYPQPRNDRWPSLSRRSSTSATGWIREWHAVTWWDRQDPSYWSWREHFRYTLDSKW